MVVARPLAHAQDDWLRRAELAVQKNEDDLAKEALRRRKSYQVSVRQIGVQKWSMAPGAPNAVKTWWHGLHMKKRRCESPAGYEEKLFSCSPSLSVFSVSSLPAATPGQR